MDDLLRAAEAAQRQRLVEAGWTEEASPFSGIRTWRTPDGSAGGLSTEDALARLDHAEGGEKP